MSSQDATARDWIGDFNRVFDPAAAQVALLDLSGNVLAINAAWQRYGVENGQPPNYDVVGVNYLAVCELAAGYEDVARRAMVGLLGVLVAGRPKFTMDYSCATSNGPIWCHMWVEPQSPAIPAVVVAHRALERQPAETDLFGTPGGGTPPA